MLLVRISQCMVVVLIMELTCTQSHDGDDLKDVYALISHLESEIAALKEHVLKQSTVGFTALIRARATYNNGQSIIFEEVVHNTNNYDPGTGMFTCPASGTYLFSVSLANDGDRNADFCIRVGSVNSGCTHATSDGGAEVGSATAVVQCGANTQVSVIATRDGTTPYGEIEGYPSATFSGVLISLDA